MAAIQCESRSPWGPRENRALSDSLTDSLRVPGMQNPLLHGDRVLGRIACYAVGRILHRVIL